MTDPYRARRPAPPPSPPQIAAKSLKYSEAQEHLLRRLGSAVVLQWHALPDALQDLLIDQAVVVGDRDEAPHEATHIEQFVRSAKSVALPKALAQ